MKRAHISFKEIKYTGYRFDASIHLSEGISARRILKKSPYPLITIADVAERVWHPGRWKRVYVGDSKHGITLLGSSAILKADFSNEKKVSLKYTENIKDKILYKNWILISCSGTIGNCAYTTAQHAEKLASQDVIRIKPNNILRPGVIFSYLSSRYGYSLLTQGTFGSVIQHIEPQHVEAIPIPNFPKDFQEKVDNLIQESVKLRVEATNCINNAIQYFNKKYPINVGTKKTFVRNMKSLHLGFASYNNNLEVDDFINCYINNSVQIKDITSRVFAPPLFKHIYLDKDNGYPFITGSELTKFNMRYYRWLSPKGVKDINDYVVQEGTLLIYRFGTNDGGILGDVFITDKHLDGCCLSDLITRVIFNDKEMAYWVYAFLRSKGAKRMLQRLSTGTTIQFIPPERIANLFIPSPDEKFNTIVKLVEDFINKSSLSKSLENEAISLVEKEIKSWNQYS